MIPLLWVVTIIIFFLMWLQPGDVVDVMCGLGCNDERREALKEIYGLDQPVYVQYVNWVSGVVTKLDFGYSPRMNMPALEVLAGEGRWFYTLLLITVAMFISWVIAVPIGIYSATHKYSLSDHFFTFLGFIGLSVPNFILGLLFIWFTVAVLRLGQLDLPGEWDGFFSGIGGFISPKYRDTPYSFVGIVNFLWHFLPPVFILAAANIAQIVRYMRGSLLDVLGMQYVQTARAKGLKEKIVVWKHAVRNAINPLISMLGFWMPYMLEGAIVVAIIFNLPQIEKSFFDAIANRDSAVVVSGLFMFSVILMFGNLISDVLLGLSDPKIRYD